MTVDHSFNVDLQMISVFDVEHQKGNRQQYSEASQHKYTGDKSWAVIQYDKYRVPDTTGRSITYSTRKEDPYNHENLKKSSSQKLMLNFNSSYKIIIDCKLLI